MVYNDQKIFSSYLIFKLIQESGNEIDREVLKERMKSLRNKFAHENQIIEFDFIRHGENVYSNRFNEIIDFGISANILGEKQGSVIYYLTSPGEEYLQNMPNEFNDVLTHEFTEAASRLIHRILEE